MNEKEFPGPTPDFFRQYTLCKGTRWTHLPVSGGWYDQHPDFVDKSYYVMRAEADADAAKRKQEEAKSKRGQAAQGQRYGSRRGRR